MTLRIIADAIAAMLQKLLGRLGISTLLDLTGDHLGTGLLPAQISRLFCEKPGELMAIKLVDREGVPYIEIDGYDIIPITEAQIAEIHDAASVEEVRDFIRNSWSPSLRRDHREVASNVNANELQAAILNGPAIDDDEDDDGPGPIPVSGNSFK